MSQETHLELTRVVYFKELLETFLEHRVSEGIRHDVETTSLLETRLHLQHADLINRGNKGVYDDSSLLGSISEALEEFDGRLQVLGVVVRVLDVDVASDELLGGLRDDHTRSKGNWASHDGHDTRASVGVGRSSRSLKKSNSHV